MIYFPGKKRIRCKECKGRGFFIIEKYEYICVACKGKKTKTIDVLVDIETLAIKIGEKLNEQKKSKD